jgi:hypothetical protein
MRLLTFQKKNPTNKASLQIVFPKAVTEAMYALISPNIKAVGTKGAYGLPCSQISSITAKLDFTFTTTGGKVITYYISGARVLIAGFTTRLST